jgi:hypothetical protein
MFHLLLESIVPELDRCLEICISSQVRQLLVTSNIVPSAPILVTLMMESLSSTETPVLTRAIWRNIPEDCILHSQHHENLISYIFLLCLYVVWESCVILLEWVVITDNL